VIISQWQFSRPAHTADSTSSFPCRTFDLLFDRAIDFTFRGPARPDCDTRGDSEIFSGQLPADVLRIRHGDMLGDALGQGLEPSVRATKSVSQLISTARDTMIVMDVPIQFAVRHPIVFLKLPRPTKTIYPSKPRNLRPYFASKPSQAPMPAAVQHAGAGLFNAIVCCLQLEISLLISFARYDTGQLCRIWFILFRPRLFFKSAPPSKSRPASLRASFA